VLMNVTAHMPVHIYMQQ